MTRSYSWLEGGSFQTYPPLLGPCIWGSLFGLTGMIKDRLKSKETFLWFSVTADYHSCLIKLKFLWKIQNSKKGTTCFSFAVSTTIQKFLVVKQSGYSKCVCEKAEEEETEWNLQMMGNWKVSFLNRKRIQRKKKEPWGSQVLNVVETMENHSGWELDKCLVFSVIMRTMPMRS